MDSENKKPNFSWFRVAGMTVAAVLILFGGVGNFVRTIKYGLKKIGQKSS